MGVGGVGGKDHDGQASGATEMTDRAGISGFWLFARRGYFEL